VKQVYRKWLSKTDTGESKTHQAGLLIPKTVEGLIDFLPRLDATQKNPSAELICIDNTGEEWCFRFVYYNGKLFTGGGTRNEFRLTRTTAFLRSRNAGEGDALEISKDGSEVYKIKVIKEESSEDHFLKRKVKLRGWQRLH